MKVATVIRATNLFDGNDISPIKDWGVVVDGGRIVAVGPYATLHIPSDVVMLNVGNATILPGLIDAHTHLLTGYEVRSHEPTQAKLARMALHAVGNFQRDMASGVTTLRCMGDPDFFDVDLKAVLKQSTCRGPDLVISTRGIQSVDGTIETLTAVPVSGTHPIRAAVKKNLERGADIIKIFVSGGISSSRATSCLYSLDEVRAAVEEAHNRGKPVAAHAYGRAPIRMCLDAEVDTIEHGALIGDEEMSMLCERRVWMVISVGIYRHLARVRAIAEELLDEIETSLQRTIKSGVRYAIGTDGMHGGLCDDIIHICEWGISVKEVLRAVTLNAARVCRTDDKLGSIEVGKTANLIVVQDNPFVDVNCLRRVLFVMREGAIIGQLPVSH